MGIIPAKAIDRRLLTAATRIGHTPRDLSEAVAGQLSPPEAQARVFEILDSVTQYDEVQERRLFLLKAAKWLDDMIDGHGDDPRVFNSINRAMKLVSDQIERTNIDVDDVNTRLASAHAEMFVRGILVGVNKALESVQERESVAVEVEILEDIVKESVEAASAYIETVTERASA